MTISKAWRTRVLEGTMGVFAFGLLTAIVNVTQPYYLPLPSLTVSVTPVPLPGLTVFGGDDAASIAGAAVAGDGRIVAVGATTIGSPAGLVTTVAPDGTARAQIFAGLRFNAVAMGQDGTAVVAGQDGATSDAMLAAIGPDGVVLWQTNIGSGLDDELSEVAITPDGGVVAAGYAGVARFSAGGELMWSRPLGLGDVTDIAVAPDGGVIAVGHLLDEPDGCASPMGCDAVVKASPTGDVVWQSDIWSLSEDQSLAAIGVAVGPAGEIFVVGDTDAAVFALKVGPTGAVTWQNTYECPQRYAQCDVSAVATSPLGGVVLVGEAYRTGQVASAGNYDAMVAAIDDGGAWAWGQTYHDGNDCNFTAVATAGDGSIVAVGVKQSRDAPSAALIARLTPDGRIR